MAGAGVSLAGGEAEPGVLRAGAARAGFAGCRLGVEETGGASLCPEVMGSEASPMCCPVSWLVAQLIPAASTRPTTAARAQISVRRLISVTLAGRWLGAGKERAVSCRLLGQADGRDRPAACAVLEGHFAVPVPGQLPCD